MLLCLKFKLLTIRAKFYSENNSNIFHPTILHSLLPKRFIAINLLAVFNWKFPLPNFSNYSLHTDTHVSTYIMCVCVSVSVFQHIVFKPLR